MLVRGPGLGAGATTVARVLREAGYLAEQEETRPHDPPVQRFERARPNQLWQTDLFTFVMRRQNRRAYMVGFMDDHSRFLVGYGVYASAPTEWVIEVLRAAIASYGAPEEVLTDNGPQFVTWRGKSAFTKVLEALGIRQVVARKKRPQTLGKIERFWGTLWRECLERAVFVDMEEARRRVGHFIDHYNFHRPNQGIDGLVPADRFFHAAPEVHNALSRQVAKNALQIAQFGLAPKPFYLTGQVGGKAFSVHAEGEQVFLTRGGGTGREEVSLLGQQEQQADPAKIPEPVTPSGQMPEGFEGVNAEQQVEPSELEELMGGPLWASRPDEAERGWGYEPEEAQTDDTSVEGAGEEMERAGEEDGGGGAGGTGWGDDPTGGGEGAGDVVLEVLHPGSEGGGGTDQRLRARAEGPGPVIGPGAGAAAAVQGVPGAASGALPGPGEGEPQDGGSLDGHAGGEEGKAEEAPADGAGSEVLQEPEGDGWGAASEP